MAKKHKKPERTPVTARKRKKGVAKRPPPKEEVLEAVDGNKAHKARSKDSAFCHAACLLYITDYRGITLKEIAEKEPFKGNVSYPMLQKWSGRDKWVERRSEFFETWRDDIKKSLGKRLVDIQVDQLMKLDALFKDVENKIEDEKPMSLGDKVTAMAKLVATSNELRDRIAKEIVPARRGARDEGMQVTPKLTESEARAAAKAIMHERRAQIRAAAGSDADEKPQLRLVDGGADGEAVDQT